MHKRQKTFLMTDGLLIEVKNQPVITLDQIRIAKVKEENKQYKRLRKMYPEDRFQIKLTASGWIINEKN